MYCGSWLIRGAVRPADSPRRRYAGRAVRLHDTLVLVHLDTTRMLAECRGHLHQIGHRVGLHLPHHLAAMRLDGDLADVKLAADLFVEQPRNYERHDVA